MARIPESPLLTALRDEAARVGEEQAFRRACACWARAAGLSMPEAWGDEAPRGGLDRAVAGLDAAELRQPAAVLGAALEALLEGDGRRGHARKRTGAYYTPEGLVEYVLGTAVDPIAGRITPGGGVLDPACGAGVFLVGAVRRLAQLAPAERAAACVRGTDINPIAVLIARFAIWLASGGAADPGMIEERIRVGDALLEHDGATPDAIVGNPPFLNQLETGTAHGRARAGLLRERYGDAARGYADTASVFLAMAMRRVRPGGRIALVQPQSVLSARDAEPARRDVLAAGALTDLWVAREYVFGASVLVCIPTVEVGANQGAVRVSAGSGFEPVDGPGGLPRAESWAPLVAAVHGIPRIEVTAPATIGDYAAATADFRDQFYGLRGCVVDAPNADDAEFPRLVTTGLVDPARCRWGEARTRIGGEQFLAPRADLRRLSGDPAMARWARARLTPKVLLATQTRVLEAVVDEAGAWLPVTPLITVVPRDPDMLWAIAAALCSPVLSAVSLREYAGAGLTASAIKLSARQVLRLPAPIDPAAWRAAGGVFRAASAAGPSLRPGLLHECGMAICSAYGMGDPQELMRWWGARLPVRGAEAIGA